MKRVRLSALFVSVMLLLCGCDLWMDGNFYDAVPHMEENVDLQEEHIVATSHNELRRALTAMVESGTEKGVIYIKNFEPHTIATHMNAAIRYVSSYNAVGAYALDHIEFDIGTNMGHPAIAVTVHYVHSRSEILRIRQTESMEEAEGVITAALDRCDPGVVVRVSDYEKTDLTQMIQDYVDATPWACMEMPQVNAVVYPENGLDRVIEISFSYQNSREALRQMQENVSPVFASAELYVQGNGGKNEKYAQLYSFLMERYSYKIETSITPAYSLLCHGVGDSKAFAVVYAAMCQRAGLECRVIYGTKAGEPWCWNIIPDGNSYLHLDLLRCAQSGGFRLQDGSRMSGYVWDYSAYGGPVNPAETGKNNLKNAEKSVDNLK